MITSGLFSEWPLGVISEGRNDLHLPAFKWVLCKGENDIEITQVSHPSAMLDVYAQKCCSKNKHLGWNCNQLTEHRFLWCNPLFNINGADTCQHMGLNPGQLIWQLFSWLMDASLDLWNVRHIRNSQNLSYFVQPTIQNRKNKMIYNSEKQHTVSSH